MSDALPIEDTVAPVGWLDDGEEMPTPRPDKTGRIVGFEGAVWIEGKHDGCTFTTEPGWTGLFAARKARRYAKRHGIQLVDQPS